MENEFFLNQPHLQIPNWQNLSSAMEIQGSEPVHDYFLNPNWEKSTDQQSLHFESALSSMVSSPAASNSNISNDSFVIRELIGKLGKIGANSTEIQHFPNTSFYSTTANNTSCYTTPLNSPPKPHIGGGLSSSSTVADFLSDPGFAERAAKFSCLGSRSFNGRSQLGMKNSEFELASRSNHHYNNPTVMNSKISRVSSSPSVNEIRLRNHVDSSPEASSLSEHVQVGEFASSNPRKRKGKGKESAQSPSSNAVKGNAVKSESNSKRSKSNEGNDDDNTKLPEPPKDYIHVRARRGQATDSHSLAERVRREKISERMKLLQDLVPGCNKVTGKALMLDEIINYVQSLQRQVEFLSMKLASVNTSLDVSMDSHSILSKDIFKSNNIFPHQIFPTDSSTPPPAFFAHRQNPSLHNLNMQLASIDGLSDQFTTFSEEDLQTIVQMGFGQNLNPEQQLFSQNFHGMKYEK